MANALTYSVVLIAYNQVDWIEEAVNAVLTQECDPIEIVLSDDCSTDGTFDSMRRMAEAYDGPHTVILNRNSTNLGLIGHINRTFTLASGEVIISIAGDDICYPNRVARTIEIFEKERPLLAFSQARVETFDGQLMSSNYRKATFYSTFDVMAAALSMHLYLGATCAWHKELYRKYGTIKYEDCYEDLILGFRAALEGRIAMIDEELVIYRVGAGLTNSETGFSTVESYKLDRRRHVNRAISVFRQRREDALVFGLQTDDPVIASIDKRLADRELRLIYLEGGFTKLLQMRWRRPFATLGAWVSERRREKKALRHA